MNLVLAQGAEILIDDEDYDKVSIHNWRINSSGHVLTTICGKTVMLHRFILNISDPNIIIDHRDRNKLNCHKYNLKQTDIKGNSRNRTSIGKVGHIGISIEQNRYRVRIKVDGKNHHVGYFPITENGLQLAIMARKQAELKYWRNIDNE